jgi:hypothetical protein
MIEYPAQAKVLAKTRTWDEREAAHSTRAVVGLSTTLVVRATRAPHARLSSVVVDNCNEPF